MALLLASIGIIIFCIIRFVLPINYDKSSENFMIFSLPSSLTCASISAAGLVATLSGLSWPLICYAFVLTIPLLGSIGWMVSCADELRELKPASLPMFTLLVTCCATWTVQVLSAIVLSIMLRSKFKRLNKDRDTNVDHNGEYLFVVD